MVHFIGVLYLCFVRRSRRGLIASRYDFSLNFQLHHWQMILYPPVYALYRKNTKIYYIVVPLVLQYLMPTFMVRKNAYRNQSFNSHCDINDTPMEVGFSGYLCSSSVGSPWPTHLIGPFASWLMCHYGLQHSGSVMKQIVPRLRGLWSTKGVGVLDFLPVSNCFMSIFHISPQLWDSLHGWNPLLLCCNSCW